jgi:hypothetical protein
MSRRYDVPGNRGVLHRASVHGGIGLGPPLTDAAKLHSDFNGDGYWDSIGATGPQPDPADPPRTAVTYGGPGGDGGFKAELGQRGGIWLYQIEAPS